MNRTLLPEASSQLLGSPSTENWLGSREIFSPADRRSTTPAHSCFSPIHYQAGYAYPLIVWLHGSGNPGAGSNEDELKQVMPLISVRNYVAIAPRGTRRLVDERGAYTWGDSAEEIAEAGQRVRDCIAIAQERFHVHPDRIYVAGHAAGGTMAYRLGMEYPDLFAGAISLGGPVPRGSRPLKNINAARQLPLLLSVSPTKENFTMPQVLDDLKFLHYAGLPLSLRLYPEGDELTTRMFSDLNKWVMKQFCSPSIAAAS